MHTRYLYKLSCYSHTLLICSFTLAKIYNLFRRFGSNHQLPSSVKHRAEGQHYCTSAHSSQHTLRTLPNAIVLHVEAVYHYMAALSHSPSLTYYSHLTSGNSHLLSTKCNIVLKDVLVHGVKP